MSRRILGMYPPLVILKKETETALLKAITEVINDYPEYIFHTQQGHFQFRVLKYLERRTIDYLEAALTVTLMGCYCKDDKLSIPSQVRQQITDQILEKYQISLTK